MDDDSKSCEKLKVLHNGMANLAGLRLEHRRQFELDGLKNYGPILLSVANDGVLVHGHALGFKVFSQGMLHVGTPWNVVVVYVRKFAQHHST